MEPETDYLDPITPGEILKEEFMVPYNLTKIQLSEMSGVAMLRISRIISGEKRIRPEDAFRLGKTFNTSAEFWLNLQKNYDLASIKQNKAFMKLLDEVKSVSLQSDQVYEQGMVERI